MRDRLSLPPTRRELLHLAAAGVTAGSAVGWFRALASGAAAPPSQPRSCILLWLSGGPSQLDTFDMKPDAGSKYSGEFRPIATNVPGIRVCELLPRVARHMDKLALLRGMSTGEAEHRRAQYLMQSGYRELPGTHHPNLGAIASAEIGRPDFELPNFMWLGSPAIAGAGYLGGKHGIVRVGQIHVEVERNLDSVRPHLPFPQFDRRVELLDHLEGRFAQQHHGPAIVADHQATYRQALRLMRSGKLAAFDLRREPTRVRESYGETQFGKGCLLARRLVEAGVPFVGVTLGDFDTHNDNWKRLRPLLPVLDQGMSALLGDLVTRGLLDSTLVICMGEFGRDPTINSTKAAAGREHYARAWTAVLGGGGLKTGQAVGGTGKTGHEVEGRPVAAKDFMATVCKALGIDYTKEYMTPTGGPSGSRMPVPAPSRKSSRDARRSKKCGVPHRARAYCTLNSPASSVHTRSTLSPASSARPANSARPNLYECSVQIASPAASVKACPPTRAVCAARLSRYISIRPCARSRRPGGGSARPRNRRPARG